MFPSVLSDLIHRTGFDKVWWQVSLCACEIHAKYSMLWRGTGVHHWEVCETGCCPRRGLSPAFLYWDNSVLSTGLIMWISHRKEIRKLTFRALALRRSVPALLCPKLSQKINKARQSADSSIWIAWESVYWPGMQQQLGKHATKTCNTQQQQQATATSQLLPQAASRLETSAFESLYGG